MTKTTKSTKTQKTHNKSEICENIRINENLMKFLFINDKYLYTYIISTGFSGKCMDKFKELKTIFKKSKILFFVVH